MNKNEIITDIYNQHIVERAISSSGFVIKDTIYDDIVQVVIIFIIIKSVGYNLSFLQTRPEYQTYMFLYWI